jgi:hypothetical protein
MLDQMECMSPLILTTKTGLSFKKRDFARLWDEAMRTAGLQQVQFAGLDKPVDLHFREPALLSRCFLRPAAHLNRSRPSRDIRLRPYTAFWNATSARTPGLAEQAIINLQSSARTGFANQLQTRVLASKR